MRRLKLLSQAKLLDSQAHHQKCTEELILNLPNQLLHWSPRTAVDSQTAQCKSFQQGPAQCKEAPAQSNRKHMFKSVAILISNHLQYGIATKRSENVPHQLTAVLC